MYTVGHSKAKDDVVWVAQSAGAPLFAADHGTPARDHCCGPPAAPLGLSVLLGGFLLGLTLVLLHHLRRGRTGPGARPWRLLWSGLPPPRPPDLARLSLLRI
jgi:hypothetical protein